MVTPQHLPLLIGEGSYAKVYKIDDLAVKRIAANKELGVETPIEAFIMTHIKSPFLNRATHIGLSASGAMDIYQELASSDLSAFVKAKPIPEQALPALLWQLCKGLEALHQHQIVHGDIKASNVLVYESEAWETTTLRLSDFSLAAMVPTSSPGLISKAFTVTHRASEVWLEVGWSYPADIWALAVTLYEVYYARLLFPKQDPDTRSRVKEAYLAVHDDWKQACHSPSRGPIKKAWDKGDFIYKPYIIDERWCHKNNHAFNSLLLAMLKSDPAERPTIQQVLSHTFFASCNSALSPPMKGGFFSDLRAKLQQLSIMDGEASSELCYLLLAYKLTRTPIPRWLLANINASLLAEEVSLLQRSNYLL